MWLGVGQATNNRLDNCWLNFVSLNLYHGANTTSQYHISVKCLKPPVRQQLSQIKNKEIPHYRLLWGSTCDRPLITWEQIIQKRMICHDDVIKWNHFPRYWPFVRGIHRSPANSPHKGQWRGALVFSLICTRINGWVNNGEAGDLRFHRVHYDVIVMPWCHNHHPLLYCHGQACKVSIYGTFISWNI